ncbi:MAG: threo-3-hydroxy-L-aspartate ammonia-lyase [Alcanivoracaceae bacterium]|nr:threo-3-hydroxy-L-aspartate ammonia-lyase [Alcanivoracaceae bacterium]
MFEQVLAAKKRLNSHANKTPVLTSQTLNTLLGAEVFFKCENFQKIGAFKFRGAFNCISQLSAQEKKRGIIAFSSGNHAQAVALVGNMLGIKTTIVMPNNAPKIKLAATKGYGAKVVIYNTETEIREEVTAAIQQQHGYSLIAPFDNKHVIAGQGTAALELFEKITDLDMLLVPCGGGGLLSGSAISAKSINPNCQVIGIEPEQADDATQSFYSGKLHSIPNPKTIADGTRTTSLGHLTFPLIQKYVDAMKTVSEQAIIEAVKFHMLRMKIVVEPSGALGLAALLSHSVKAQGKIGVIISGGNIDPATLVQILENKI